ncbi:alanine--tRNA ligase [Thermodesulfobacteriota bacterium]
MNFREIRHTFLDYFQARGHAIVPSSSLIPRDDPTLLFTNAGMVQFKSLFLGEESRGYSRAATSQKCVRAGGKHNDLENVGFTARHHTFFEMLGNFSFGDYFKKQAILWAWELLTESFGLPTERLWVSVYHDDDEAHRIWQEEINVPSQRIIPLGEKDNFWVMGETGPCGPCSEIYIDQGAGIGCGREDCRPGCDCDRYLEIWNLVFTQFDRDSQGNMSPLPNPNIDTGMGLERLCAVIQGVTSNYDTDLFRELIGHIEELSAKRYGQNEKESIPFRVIADHARAVAFLIGDGILPSNEGRGYVLRRIIRRAIRFGQTLDLQDAFLHRVTHKVIDIMGQDYPELVDSRSFIEGVVTNEEKRFADTLYYGMKVLREQLDELKEKGKDVIPGAVLFKLYDTYGLSADIVEDVAKEEGLKMDMSGYEKAMTVQRTTSQESWKGSGEEAVPEAYRRLLAKGLKSQFLGYEGLVSNARIIAILVKGESASRAERGDEVDVILDRTPFYGEAGGQMGDEGRLFREGTRVQVNNSLKIGQDLIIHKGKVEEGTITLKDEVEAKVDEERRKATARNHTATHLLHAALREVLGDHVKQAGSLVSPDRLRFDFSHFTQLGHEKLIEVESLVNRHIRDNLPLTTEEMLREEAVNTGAIAIFEEKYGERVRLVRVGNGISMELCGGTHTSRTGDVALFKIISEGAVGANLRRIEALTGEAAIDHVQKLDMTVKTAASRLKAAPDEINERVERLLRDQKDKDKEIESLRAKLLGRESGNFLDGAKEIKGIRVVAREVKAASPKDLREMADRTKEKLASGIIVLAAQNAGKAMLICVVTDDLTDKFQAGKIMKQLAIIVGGKGGGRADMAQGGGPHPGEIGKALDSVCRLIEEEG